MSTSQQLPVVENQEEHSKDLEGVLGANYRQLTLGLILIILGPPNRYRFGWAEFLWLVFQRIYAGYACGTYSGR